MKESVCKQCCLGMYVYVQMIDGLVLHIGLVMIKSLLKITREFADGRNYYTVMIVLFLCYFSFNVM